MNVVIYARYSDSKQREESIEGQLKVCYDYAEKEHYTVIGEYIDRAISGRTDDRPQFQKMIRDSDRKLFQGILVYQLDRFARSRYDSAHYKYHLKTNGVVVISARENISDDASGILIESVLEGMAEYYSKELSQKVQRGMKLNAEKCLSNGGSIPLGYRIEDRRYVVDEKTAPIVREIYTKYANGWTKKQICDNLNERQIRSAKGAEFNKNSLHKILKNEKYIGVYVYGDIRIPGGIPAIVDEALFHEVQEKLAENKAAPARSRAKAEYILSGKLYCGYCKEKMVGHSSNQVSKKGVIFNYYKCKNSGGQKPCKKKMVHKDFIENVVVDECRKQLTPKNIKKIAHEVVRIAKSMEDHAEQRRLEKLLEEAEQAKENQMSSLRHCTNDAVRQMIFDDLAAIASEIEELTKQIETEKMRHYVVTEQQVTDYLIKLADGDIHNPVYRKSLIKMFVNKIFLYDDKFTILFNTADEETAITDVMLDQIEKSVSGEKLCLLSPVAHHVGASNIALAPTFCKSRGVLTALLLLCKPILLCWVFSLRRSVQLHFDVSGTVPQNWFKIYIYPYKERKKQYGSQLNEGPASGRAEKRLRGMRIQRGKHGNVHGDHQNGRKAFGPGHHSNDAVHTGLCRAGDLCRHG